MSDDERPWIKRRFADLLGRVDDEPFLLLIWGLNALQSGNPTAGAEVFPFGIPPNVASEDMTTSHAVYPWELETIANELLATPKRLFLDLPSNRWEVVPEIVNLLRRIDDLDFAARGATVDIFRELFRIGGRQFDWQRGYLNAPQFYRSVFIYGQGGCAEYFRATYGIGINELTVVGFGMYASLVQRPNFMSNGDFSLLGVTPEMRDTAVNILSAPLRELRRLAGQERERWDIMAYRPSILRRFPCVRLGSRGRRIRSPLPALILERITSGLFYDVISGGGAIRNEYGRRFELYALRYLRAMLPVQSTLPEWSYRVAGNRFETPDIVASATASSDVQFAIECKASRMSFGARFADEPQSERGYEDMVKAIFQLWRFFSHCRRGHTGRSLAREVVGLVLTLDSWMVMGSALFDDIFARAEIMARERDPEIEARDRKPIAFCSIPDFESALTIGTADTFRAALRHVAEPEHRGSYVQPHHAQIVGGDAESRDYPFQDLSAMLPWWGQIEAAKAASTAPAGG